MIKQFGGTGYESSDVMVIDEVEMQRHQQLEKLYRSTRNGRVGDPFFFFEFELEFELDIMFIISIFEISCSFCFLFDNWIIVWSCISFC